MTGNRNREWFENLKQKWAVKEQLLSSNKQDDFTIHVLRFIFNNRQFYCDFDR